MFDIEDSITYWEIINKGFAIGLAEAEAKGRLEEAHEFLVLVATNRFGPPSAAVLRKLRAIDDLTRLRQIAKCIYEVRSWKDLLAVK